MTATTLIPHRHAKPHRRCHHAMGEFERKGILLKYVKLSANDALKPNFLDKVKTVCRRRPDHALSQQALSIFSHSLAKQAYLQFCVTDGNYYEAVNVNPSDDTREIKRVAKRLLLTYHVDKWGDKNKIVETFATQITQFLNNVRDVLEDPTKRREYDLSYDAGSGDEADEVSEVDSEAEAREFFGGGRKKKKRKNQESEIRKRVHILTLRELYIGKTVQNIDMGGGNKATIQVPPRTLPGWSTILAPPGREAVRIVFDVKPESLGTFYVDEHKRLCREVEIEPINALCGRGDIVTTTPDGRKVKAKLTKPVNHGDTAFEFEGEGFGKNAMFGIAAVRGRVFLSFPMRERIWNAYKND